MQGMELVCVWAMYVVGASEGGGMYLVGLLRVGCQEQAVCAPDDEGAL